MENLIKLLIAIFVSIGSFSFAQDAFYRTYSGSTFDEGQGIAQMADSGYIITGSTAGFSGSSDAFLTRLDKFGVFEWSKKFGGENSDRGRRVFYEEGEGMWCFGYTNSFNAQSFDFYLFKTDEDGELEWETVLGTPDWERLYDATRLPNGDFILVGETQGADALNEDILVVRIDDLGNEVWMERIQTSGSDVPHAISVLNDTTVIVVGEAFDGTGQAGFILSMHIDGSTNWMNFYEPTLHGTFYDVDIYDNEIYAVGGLIAAGETEPDLWMIRTDDEGVIIYDHVDTYDGTVYISKVKMLGDGRLYVSVISDAPSFNPFTDGVDHYFMKYHQNLFWNGLSRSFSGVNDDLAHQMIETNDGGIAIIGTVSDNRVIDSPGTDITVIKIGENDETEQNPTSDELVSVVEFDNLVVEVFPNPMVNTLTIVTPDNKDVNYSIVSSDGRVQMSGMLTNTSIDVSQLASGAYFLLLQLNNEVKTIKLMK